MPRSLPADAEAVQGPAETPTRDCQLVNLLQVLSQQGMGPAGRTIPQQARVLVDDGSAQRIADPGNRGGAAGARAVRKPALKIEPAAA